MCLTRLIGCALAAAVLVACAKNDSADPPEQVVQAALRAERAPSAINQRTSDGESVRVHQPEIAPTVEVQVGGVCAVRDARGTLLSCVPGTHCVRASPGAAGTCVAAPPPPANE
jgi:hypothetical protein